MRVCIGGTFYPFHKGHKLLVKTAIKIAGKQGLVFIGITTETMTKNKKNVDTFEKRKQMIKRYINKLNASNQVKIQPIKDKYGPSINGDFDVIIVSPETYKTAKEINQKRIEKGKKPLVIIQIPFVLADDVKPISSTRIKNKEIDENGHLLTGD